jgi:hypothetical protein
MRAPRECADAGGMDRDGVRAPGDINSFKPARERLMDWVAEVAVRLKFAPGATVSFGDPLELSLDCPVCRRRRRTVIFREGQTEGVCTPTRHPFPGRITGKEVVQHGLTWSAAYRVAYRYEPFTDAKYPSEKPSGQPSWARMPFEVVCPECGRVTKTSTQSNLVRPRSCQCQCGRVLFTEQDPMPALSFAKA